MYKETKNNLFALLLIITYQVSSWLLKSLILILKCINMHLHMKDCEPNHAILFFSHGKSPVVWKTWGWWAWVNLTRRVCFFSQSAQIPSLFYCIKVCCAVFVQLWFFWNLDGIWRITQSVGSETSFGVTINALAAFSRTLMPEAVFSKGIGASAPINWDGLINYLNK